MRIHGFDWDETNIAKVRFHDLEPDDVELVFENDGEPKIIDHPENPARTIALGFVPDGRFVLVVFEYDAELFWVRVVTAYEAEHERWWQIYTSSSSGGRARRRSRRRRR